MNRGINWHPYTWDDYLWWQNNDRKTLRKINNLIKTSCRTTIDGAEPLKGDLTGYYSRHINKKDVLVYKYDDDSITIIQCRFHYKDK